MGSSGLTARAMTPRAPQRGATGRPRQRRLFALLLSVALLVPAALFVELQRTGRLADDQLRLTPSSSGTPTDTVGHG